MSSNYLPPTVQDFRMGNTDPSDGEDPSGKPGDPSGNPGNPSGNPGESHGEDKAAKENKKAYDEARRINELPAFDYYGYLRLKPDFTLVEIKKRYRKLACLVHPDKNKFNGAKEAFQSKFKHPLEDSLGIYIRDRTLGGIRHVDRPREEKSV